MNANSHPLQVVLVDDADMYANSHPYKVVIEGSGGGLVSYNGEVDTYEDLPDDASAGAMYYVTEDSAMYLYDGSAWIALSSSGGGTTYHAGDGLTLSGTVFSVDTSVVATLSALADVATSGDYTDLSNTPTAGEGLTLEDNEFSVDTDTIATKSSVDTLSDSVDSLSSDVSSKAESVDGDGASHVEFADEIYTTTTQIDTSQFQYRTSAGSVSIDTGPAILNFLYGRTVQTGHTDESLTFSYDFADEETTAEINESTFKTYISETTGVYDFTYDGTDWLYNSSAIDISDYGITITGTPAEDDTMQVNYQALVVGTLTTATPTALEATGFNQYDADSGYAHVVGGNVYRIDGTYTSLGFTTTIGGATETVTVTNDRFTPEEDGYIYVTGGSGDILIALVWSGTMDSETYVDYETSTVTIPTEDEDGTALPTDSYGMPSVGDVTDVLDFVGRTYTQNIGYYAYSAANLATVEAMGVDYWYDLSSIFYVLEEPVVYTLDSSVSGDYTVNDYGTEEILGTSIAMTANITYGNSLVDKLRNLLTIQSLGDGLELDGTTLKISYDNADTTEY